MINNAQQELRIRAAKLFAVLMSAMLGISAFLQIVGGAPMETILPLLGMFIINLLLSYWCYARLRHGKSPHIVPWIICFATIGAAYYGKYNYGVSSSWTYSMQSYQHSVSAVSVVIFAYLFMDKKLVIFAALCNYTAYALVFYAGYTHGGVLYTNVMSNGIANVSGAITR